jgi:Replication-relaxation
MSGRCTDRIRATSRITAGQPPEREIIYRQLPPGAFEFTRKKMTMPRASTASLTTLVDQLSERDQAILADLERTRVLTGAQLQRLHFAPNHTPSRARDRRRVLQRLTELDLMSTLDRRIGGIRAGSAGHIYTLTPTGLRLRALQRGQQLTRRPRRPRTPGAPFLNHALTISDIYVTLTETSRHRDFHVSTFLGEPACWHPTENNQHLHPDAYLVLATSTHQDCWWLEVDLATETLPRIKRKCRIYLDFLTRGGIGPDNVPPRILFTTPDNTRSDAIKKVITKQASTETSQLICVTTHDNAPQFLITELTNP